VVLQFLRYDFHNIKNVSFEHFHIHITHIWDYVRHSFMRGCQMY
jgi:hypothetical protein